MEVFVNRLTQLILGLALCTTPLLANDGPPIQPLSNPLYAESAVPQSRLTLSYAWQQLPNQLRTKSGNLSLDGDASMLNVAIEYNFAKNWSLELNKSGYIWVNADQGGSSDGLADLGLALKWRFLKEGDLHLAARIGTEWPTGDEDVLQGNGNGTFSPALLGTYDGDSITLNVLYGLILPFDRDEESSSSIAAAGAAYRLGDSIILHGELNWFRVIKEGDGSAKFDGRGFNDLGNLADVAEFEGGDYFNLGAANGADNRDLVTGALGVSYLLTEKISLGASYEKSLTAAEKGLLDDRVNLVVTLSF
jgi:hypothetical protein